jgi:hypothetical protein
VRGRALYDEAMDYDEAVAKLYQAPHGGFVDERKRLAGELKAAGDKAGATKLGKLPRPPISAWTVNQLWWHARADVEALFESAEKLREDMSASAEHRNVMAKLRQRAAKILQDNEHAATESTLRRITTTLSALAVTGGFDPDPPGALSADRDPPGFEAVGITATEAVHKHAKPKSEKVEKPKDTRHEEEERTKREQAEAAAERKKKEQAEAKRLAELRGVEHALSGAKSELERKQKELERLEKAVEGARATVEKSQAAVDELEAKLAEMVRANEET